MTAALFLTDALIFLTGLLVGACVVRARFLKLNRRWLIEIGGRPILSGDGRGRWGVHWYTKPPENRVPPSQRDPAASRRSK